MNKSILKTAKSLKPINPMDLYNSKMTQLRNQYRQEYLQELSKNPIKKPIPPTDPKDIIAQNQTINVKPVITFTPVTESNHSSFISSDAQENSKPSVMGMTREQVKAHLESRDLERFHRFLETRKSLQEERSKTLLYLYHASADFITPNNLDAKIEECLSSNPINEQKSVVEMLRETATQDSPAKRLTDMRKSALKDELMGTVDGKMGPDAIQRVLKQQDHF